MAVVLHLSKGADFHYHMHCLFLCPQGDKPSEGAGPLRTVKSDGQADERPSATVNSVRLNFKLNKTSGF